MSKHERVFENKKGLSVDVRGSNIDQAIRLLNKKVKGEGLIRELRKRQAYESPSEEKRRRKAEAVSRWRKTLSQREL